MRKLDDGGLSLRQREIARHKQTDTHSFIVEETEVSSAGSVYVRGEGEGGGGGEVKKEAKISEKYKRSGQQFSTGLKLI